MTSNGQKIGCRGVRGAITAHDNSKEAIHEATCEMLAKIIEVNNIQSEDLSSAFFTMTTDLNANYPALAARTMGWSNVPLLCGQEIDVPGGMGHVIRVLLHWNTPLPQDEVQHVYLRDAARLRPDISMKTSEKVSI